MKKFDVVQRIRALLERHPEGIPQSHLVQALKISKGYLSSILQELEKLGIIERVRIGNMYIVKLVQRQSSEDVKRSIKLGIVWSSEYPFISFWAKLLRDRLGIELLVRVYSNAVNATYALVKGEVDAVLSPLITQVHAYILTKSVKIVAGGAYGGAAIYELASSTNTVISSELSTMDICRALALKEGYIDADATRYFVSPEEALKLVRKGSARFAVVWSPLTYEVSRYAIRRVVSCSDFEELAHCCTLALGIHIPYDLMIELVRLYKESIDLFKRRPMDAIPWYSSITGIDSSIIAKSISDYGYKTSLDIKRIKKMLQSLNIVVPAIDSVMNAFLDIENRS